MSTALATLTKKTGPKPIQRDKCKVEGCDSIAKHPVSMLCSIHYTRKKRTGTFTKNMRDSGDGTITTYGYVAHCKNKKKTFEHVTVVEKVLGKKLPDKAVIHHVNHIKNDNRNNNLVVCPDKSYHFMIHTREKALDACGNADYRKCPFCKNYDDPQEMVHSKHGRHFYHSQCKKEYKCKMVKPV